MIYQKLELLRAKISKLKKVIVAFSGGVDSTFLLKVCADVLGNQNVIAVTANSETYPPEELRAAKEFAKRLGVAHFVIRTNELCNPNFYRNSPNRCYFCKKELVKKLKRVAEEQGIKYILEASNSDDLKDYRPGRKALEEEEVLSPLLDFSKEEIRKLSKKMGLPTWNKPSQPCLASRFPYGIRITKEALNMVRKAETFLKKLGFKNVRVRHHEALARIEVDRRQIKKLVSEKVVKLLAAHFKKLGYIWVAVDIEGYRQGSLNEVLKK